MEVHILRGLLIFIQAAAVISDELGSELTFVSELSSKPSQKLSRYGWYGNVRLHQFQVPPDVAVARWLFSVTKGSGFHCGQHNVTVYISWGSPPVIDPLSSAFPNNTVWTPALSMILPVTIHTSTTFNLSNPAPGDWYLAAHLPRDDGRIEQKGFPSCSYYFQPQLSIRRAVDTPTLVQATPLTQTASIARPALLKVFVPEFVSSLTVSVTGCTLGAGLEACSLVLKLGSSSLREGLVSVNCSAIGCSATLTTPPWNAWVRVVVESVVDNHTATFSIMANSTVVCKPSNEGLKGDDDIIKLRGRSSLPFQGNMSVVSEVCVHGNVSSGCVWYVPVLREELDVLSLQFTPVNGPAVNVTHTHHTLLRYPLNTHSSGGILNLLLTLNTTNMTSGSVEACFSPRSPRLNTNLSQHCHTGLYAGHTLRVKLTAQKAVVRIPFPMSATWYLSLLLTCNSSDCGGVPVVAVVPDVHVSSCVEDCGTLGECRLLRSSSFLYAACSCKAGWSGWGCTDGSSALSYSRQVTAVLLLTLSNLLFIPAIVVAMQRCYFTEAAVYLFTMFFSTFYHACDQPGVAVLCIMDYDALQFCDFLGSVCSIWVTILCMARLPDTLKYTVFMLGAMLIAMSLQLDRRGLWNMLGPVLCAALAMLSTWVYRGVSRRQCYPPLWRRWVCFLLPGLGSALVGVCLYVFAETEDNYLYIHSLWHVLVAVSVVFLLPPRHTHTHPWGSWWPRVCGYTLCQGTKDELYTVT
ncbi:post-GPI attachment to proteins factor 6 isoform X1 [Hypomesus transpacificus]|uniref:post-GPI attachment to proteins factor 6 isoform X1 n=1 Tax=Hypomesus transpacificus TaxID=137520 RepID=UPI001F079F62|nr:post-GPI attachment to proteins factor 6 isoform X1 [Hypomesus transpacificus]